MTPQELQRLHAGRGLLSGPLSRPNGLCSASITEGSIKLYLALHQDTSATHDELLNDLKEMAEQHGGDIEDAVTEEGVPATEAVGPLASQLLVHKLAGFTGNMVGAAASGAIAENMNREALSRAAYLGGVGVAGSALVMGGSLLSKGEVDAQTMGVGALYLSTLLALSYNSLRTYFGKYTNHRFMVKVGDTAAMFASTVANDIHATYCTEHFDQKAQEAGFEDSQNS
jgi:hypothetical protein